MPKFLLSLYVHLFLRKYNSWKINFPFSECIGNLTLKFAILLLQLNHIIAGLKTLKKKI